MTKQNQIHIWDNNNQMEEPLEFTKCFMSVMSSNPHKHPASFFLDLEELLKELAEEFTSPHAHTRPMAMLGLGKRLKLCLGPRPQSKERGCQSNKSEQLRQLWPSQEEKHAAGNSPTCVPWAEATSSSVDEGIKPVS